MILQIFAKVPEDVDIYFRINNHEELLNIDNPLETVTLEKIGEYQIYFYQKKASNKFSIFRFFFYLSTSVIQGIFHILLLNTDSEWWNRINPYCLRADLTTKLVNDEKIIVKYKKSYYKESSDTWIKPTFIVNSDVQANIEYLPNPYDFRKQYFNFVKKYVSIASIGFILFLLLLYSAIMKNDFIFILIMVSLILILICIIFFVLLKEHRRMNKLYKSFMEKNQC